MRIWHLLPFLLCLGAVFSCSDDDHNDEDVLDMGKLTGKYWYYNKWQNNRESYVLDDLLDIVRFEGNGKLWEMDFSGKNERIVGTWTHKDNEIVLHYTNRPEEIWNVLKSGEGFIDAMVLSGKREYKAEPDYLKDLTADAFLVDEVKNDGLYPETRIGISIEGKNAVNIAKDAAVILAEDAVVGLTLENKVWHESKPILAADFGLPTTEKAIRFYIKANGNPVKFTDTVYTQSLPKRKFADFALNAVNQDRVLHVSWAAFDRQDVYYRVEVLNVNASEEPYYVSRLLPAGTDAWEITETTETERDLTNNMKKLKAGQNYTVRLSAIVLEPGTSVGDMYSYTNRQAVSFVEWKYLWQ